MALTPKVGSNFNFLFHRLLRCALRRREIFGKAKRKQKKHSRKFNFNLPRKPGTTRSVQESFGTFPFFLDVTIFTFMLQCSCIQTFRFFNLAHLPRNDNFFLTNRKKERKTKWKLNYIIAYVLLLLIIVIVILHACISQIFLVSGELTWNMVLFSAWNVLRFFDAILQAS